MPHDDDPLSAWEPQEPSAGFAERVALAARADRDAHRGAGANASAKRRRARAGAITLVAFAAAAAATFLFLPSRDTASTGGARASESRSEAHIGERATAVLEPGSTLTWSAHGNEVVQPRGNVFYRVEPGAKFVVHTPAGDVTVKGTCFRVKVREEPDMNARDVKVAGVGAVLGAAAFVGVYEGKVALSHAQSKTSVDVGAGESARSDASGVHKSGDVASGEKSFDEGGAATTNNEPLMAANQNLAESVKAYKDRLVAIEAEKQKLAKDLKDAQDKLAVAMNDGQAPLKKSEWDVTTDDWKELAKDGTVKFRLPCVRAKDWSPKPSSLTSMGLSPSDGPTLKNAYTQSNARIWAVVRPLCIQAIGSAEVADRIGAGTCTHLVMDMERDKDPNAVDDAMRLVAEVRAGERPMPGPNDAINPVAKMFFAMTGEIKNFESDLAQSLGPDEAHRLAYGENGCWQSSRFGGPGPRSAKPE